MSSRVVTSEEYQVDKGEFSARVVSTAVGGWSIKIRFVFPVKGHEPYPAYDKTIHSEDIEEWFGIPTSVTSYKLKPERVWDEVTGTYKYGRDIPREAAEASARKSLKRARKMYERWANTQTFTIEEDENA